MKRFCLALSLFLSVSCRAQAALETLTYTIDPRKYFESDVRKNWPYNVILGMGKGNLNKFFTSCTGTAVSPEIGVSAGHCTVAIGQKVTFITRVGRYNIQIPGTVVERRFDGCDHDYSIIKFDVDNSPQVKQILKDMRYPHIAKDIDVNSKIINVGFGNLRIVADEELVEAKDIFINHLKEIRYAKAVANGEKAVNIDKLDEAGYEVLNSGDAKRTDALSVINSVLAEKGKKPFTPDNSNAKIDSTCSVSEIIQKKDASSVKSDCLAWSGNSGGPILINTGGDNYTLAGIMTCSSLDLSMKDPRATSTHPREYYDILMKYLNEK